MLTVYSKDNCPFCMMAKSYLESKNIEFEIINIMENQDAKDLIMNAGHRTVPQIYFKDTVFVEGGYQGLTALSLEELGERLSECIPEWDRVLKLKQEVDTDSLGSI